MERWLIGVLVPALLLLPALSGCTEPEPLYCDAEHPCTQAGYTCMYSRRTCIFKGGEDSGADAATVDSSVTPDTGGVEQSLPEQGAPEQGVPPDGHGGDASGGADQ